MRRLSRDPLARFREKIAEAGPTECWLWRGATLPKGYGTFGYGGERGTVLAHRLAYELANGKLAPGQHVLHHCDNPACCNPSHLFAGDNATNMRDRDAKHRVRHGDVHPCAELTDAQVSEIMRRLGSISQRQLAAEYGVHQVTISKIKRGVIRARATGCKETTSEHRHG